MIEEVLDEEFLDSSSLDDDDTDLEDDSHPQMDIMADHNGRASYNAWGGTEDPIKNSDSKAGETIPDVEGQRGTSTSAPSFEKAKPLLVLWTLSCMWYETDKARTEACIRILLAWVHPKKRNMVNADLIAFLLTLDTKTALDYLEDLKDPKQYIVRKQGVHNDAELNIKAEVIAPTTSQIFKVKALLDSGCTGSCINQAFVDKNDIVVKQFDYPIAVYNTDGMENTNGKIMSYVDLNMTIDGHKETHRFTVTNLNCSDIFIRHDWLWFHNPEIDWTTKSIRFTRCPPQCNMEQAEAEQLHNAWSDPVELEEGDRLFTYPKQLPRSIR